MATMSAAYFIHMTILFASEKSEDIWIKENFQTAFSQIQIFSEMFVTQTTRRKFNDPHILKDFILIYKKIIFALK